MGADLVILAIVGSTAFAERGTPERAEATRLINDAIDRYQPDEIVSGGAVGIDSMAAMAAHARGIPTREFLPKNKRWKPDGYQARNLLIAEACTSLVSIRHHASTTYGSGWTADRAEEIGKSVERYMIRAVDDSTDISA